ncbi:MAG: glycosyltransferase family 39 protein [Acidobacteriota bacterium]|nr:glycosyltransferase family 39 protein [Acidobacteriota bacterium]
MDRGRWRWIVLIAVLLLTATVRYRLLDVPLERDEGEYAYAGQLILQGVPPYESVYNMKLPGIYAAYAVILWLFGESPAGVHLGLLLANATAIVLVFLLGERLAGSAAGCVAAASFALMSVSASVQGVFANAEHFVLVPALAGLLLFLIALDRERAWLLFGSGVFLGTAFIVKQPGAAFAAVAVVYLFVVDLGVRPIDFPRFLRRAASLVTGLLVPPAVTVVALIITGVFERFRFWAIEYAGAYATQVPLSAARELLRFRGLEIVSAAPLLWLLVLGGLVATVADRRRSSRPLFVGLLVVFSAVAVSVGLYFRPHYFVLALPAAAVLAGVSFAAIEDRVPNRSRGWQRFVAVALVAVVFGVSVFQQRALLFVWSPAEVSRAVFAYNPFPESIVVGDYLREHSDPGDTVAVLGSEPQIYFYSRRRSATGYIYAYPWMEDQPFALEMQEEAIRDIEKARPRFIVYVRVEPSWQQRGSSPTRIFEWLAQYQRGSYTVVGLVEMPDEGPRYHWAPKVPWPPKSPRWISVMERRPE